MSPGRRFFRRTRGKPKESQKWRAKADELVPLIQNRPELKRMLLLFEGSPAMHWITLNEVSPSYKILEQKGVIHLLPDNRRFGLTTVGKILLEKFSEAKK